MVDDFNVPDMFQPEVHEVFKVVTNAMFLPFTHEKTQAGDVYVRCQKRRERVGVAKI